MFKGISGSFQVVSEDFGRPSRGTDWFLGVFPQVSGRFHGASGAFQAVSGARGVSGVFYEVVK